MAPSTSPGRAIVSYLHPGTVRAEFMRSTVAMARHSADQIETILDLRAGPNLSRWRNAIVEQFLGFDVPWLLMADTDMVFAPDALSRLLAAADPAQCPILGALCFSEGDDGGEPYSTMYELLETSEGPRFTRYAKWPEGTVVPVTATGTGFLLVHREVFTSIVAHKHDPVAPWFRESTLGGALMGEDLTFCLRARAAGIPVHVHTGVQVGHVKTAVLGKVS